MISEINKLKSGLEIINRYEENPLIKASNDTVKIYLSNNPLFCKAEGKIMESLGWYNDNNGWWEICLN
jgi:hypothetical protein